jgi:hypothetical protein
MFKKYTFVFVTRPYKKLIFEHITKINVIEGIVSLS